MSFILFWLHCFSYVYLWNICLSAEEASHGDPHEHSVTCTCSGQWCRGPAAYRIITAILLQSDPDFRTTGLWGEDQSQVFKHSLKCSIILFRILYYLIKRFQTLREKSRCCKWISGENERVSVFLQDERRSTLSRASAERWDMRRWKDELHRSRKPIQV